MRHNDIIAAIASPLGPAARIILRVSGRGTAAMLQTMGAEQGVSAGVSRVRLPLDDMQAPALVIWFTDGHGYTGEEGAELHLPGNAILATMVLQALIRAGARQAEPGEFTARAFFNGRLDLTEAEGVAATIHATSQRELDAARRLQDGELTRRLRPVVDGLVEIVSLLEAGIDFAEEDIHFITRAELLDRVTVCQRRLQAILNDSGRLESLAREPVVVLCGRPNAGKSTLLNALARRRRAVVSAAPGTTRDLLYADVELRRGLVRLVDTAGLEQGDGAADDIIARQMRERATEAIERSDVMVLVVESGQLPPTLPVRRRPDLVVTSKCDMDAPRGECCVSAVSGYGMDELRTRLDDLAFGSTASEALAINSRHLAQITSAIEELAKLESARELSDELLAEYLRYAMDALGEITGVVSPDDVLEKVFAGFCIGK